MTVQKKEKEKKKEKKEKKKEEKKKKKEKKEEEKKKKKEKEEKKKNNVLRFEIFTIRLTLSMEYVYTEWSTDILYNRYGLFLIVTVHAAYTVVMPGGDKQIVLKHAYTVEVLYLRHVYNIIFQIQTNIHTHIMPEHSFLHSFTTYYIIYCTLERRIY